MDTTSQFPDDDEFHELAQFGVRKVRKHSEGGMVSGVQLESNVFALKAHVWASGRVSEMVGRLVGLLGRGIKL